MGERGQEAHLWIKEILYLPSGDEESVDWKKYMQPKSWELGFIRWEYLDSSQSPDSLSPDGRQRADSEEEGEEPGYTQVLQQGAGNLNIKRLLLN